MHEITLIVSIVALAFDLFLLYIIAGQAVDAFRFCLASDLWILAFYSLGVLTSFIVTTLYLLTLLGYVQLPQ